MDYTTVAIVIIMCCNNSLVMFWVLCNIDDGGGVLFINSVGIPGQLALALIGGVVVIFPVGLMIANGMEIILL